MTTTGEAISHANKGDNGNHMMSSDGNDNDDDDSSPQMRNSTKLFVLIGLALFVCLYIVFLIYACHKKVKVSSREHGDDDDDDKTTTMEVDDDDDDDGYSDDDDEEEQQRPPHDKNLEFASTRTLSTRDKE